MSAQHIPSPLQSLDIFPSLLEDDPKTVFNYVEANSRIFNHFQIDIADDQLVQGKTFSVEDCAHYIQNNPSPLYKSNTFEFHLMVEEFDLDIKDLILLSSDINISLIIVHLEALINIYPDSQNYHQDLQKLSTMFNFGFAIQADSPLKESLSALVDFPVAQIMTIQPGGQGRPFEERSMEHISTLRNYLYNGYIQLDGGINDKTLPIVLSQKDLPDAVCPGSYLKEDSASRLHTLKGIFRETLQK